LMIFDNVIDPRDKAMLFKRFNESLS